MSMNTLSTHDTKAIGRRARAPRGADRVTGRWRTALHRWSRCNRQFKTGEFPDRNTEYHLYQTLVGAWPIEPRASLPTWKRPRAKSKEHTSWTQPNKELAGSEDIY